MRLLPIALSASLLSINASPLNDQPVIGILTYPNNNNPNNATYGSYFDASYLQWLSQSGARVAPIRYDLPLPSITALVAKLNGVLFTGGPDMPATNLAYYNAASHLFQLTLNNTDNDLPLWGTCLGFETISSLGGGIGDEILGEFDAEKLSLPLEGIEIARSKIFQGMTDEQLMNVQSNNVTTNWHSFGVSLDDFEEHLLPVGFIPSSVNVDRDGKTFVSTMEHEEYPIYATQWHPEANQFDGFDKKGDNTPNFGVDGVKNAQYFADFFVEMARESERTFDDESDWEDHVVGRISEDDSVFYDGFVYYFSSA